MHIDQRFHKEIQELNVNSHKVSCEYTYWNEWFKEDELMLSRIVTLKEALGDSFGRAELVEFYKGESDIKTKFLATMVWGHEAPAGSRRDTRGPWKVEQMFESIENSTVLSNVKVETEIERAAAYSAMNKAIKRCGPSFITKHLYFLGKSINQTSYPLIYDDRVSVGLVKISLTDHSCLDLVSIHAESKVKAYI
jgi:hypothetical protein